MVKQLKTIHVPIKVHLPNRQLACGPWSGSSELVCVWSYVYCRVRLRSWESPTSPGLRKTVSTGSQVWEGAVGRGDGTGEGSGWKMTGRRGRGRTGSWRLRAEITTRLPFPTVRFGPRLGWGVGGEGCWLQGRAGVRSLLTLYH